LPGANLPAMNHIRRISAHLPVLAVAAAICLACAGTAVAYDAHNARAVDGLHATQSTIDELKRAGKLVAADDSGHLPNNIIKEAPSAGDVKCQGCIDSTKLDAPAPPADGQVLGFHSGTLDWEAISHTVSACPAAKAVQAVNAAGAPTCSPFWAPGGNSGLGGSSFLGTTDNTPLTFKANGQRVLQFQPSATSPNVLGGFSGSSITSGAVGSTIAGGGNSTYPNLVTDSYGTVAGGLGNQAGDKAGTVSDQIVATVGGGGGNVASGGYSTVAGGYFNTASGAHAVVAGGYRNLAAGLDSEIGGGYQNWTSDSNGTVAGGYKNSATGLGGTVGGGWNNTAGKYGTVAGGDDNVALGKESFAAGGGADVYSDNAFVWNGNYKAAQQDAGPGSFTANAPGGFVFYTGGGAGAYLASGSGSWSTLSDRHAKKAIHSVRYGGVLRRLRSLPVRTWAYDAEHGGIRHMGPMAQAFYRRFGLGESKHYISTVDAQGVALAAIKGLDAKVRAQGREINRLRKLVAK
jgi:endosialidase-like protein